MQHIKFLTGASGIEMKLSTFFQPEITTYFVMFSRSHLVCIALLAVAIIGLYACRNRLAAQPHATAAIRYLLVAALLVPEVGLHIWYVSTGIWDVLYTLPLELCSITLLLSIVMLLARSYSLYQVLYFAGLGGAVQAILTPNLDYPFPHFRFLHFFIVHSAIILAPLYMTWIERVQPTFRSIGIAMLFLNVLAVIVGVTDYWLGANYMFLLHKPRTASILDYLGNYPYYLLSEEVIALVTFGLLYLPFSRIWKKNRNVRAKKTKSLRL
jgi:hypothetical integral membrane protein (TIGR02206 family)